MTRSKRQMVSESDVLKIFELRAKGRMTHAEIARRTGFSQSCVGRILHRKVWDEVPVPEDLLRATPELAGRQVDGLGTSSPVKPRSRPIVRQHAYDQNEIVAAIADLITADKILAEARYDCEQVGIDLPAQEAILDADRAIRPDPQGPTAKGGEGWREMLGWNGGATHD